MPRTEMSRTHLALVALAAGAALLSTAVPAAALPLGGAATVPVSTAKELKAALAAASPGDTIQLADGTYTGNFKTDRAGTAAAPITLSGSASAVLTAGGGYGLHLNGASNWRVRGITVTGGQKGIVLDNADGVRIDGVTVHGLDMEAVHFRTGSADGSISDSRIYDTGNDNRGMGEGVYVGSAGGSDASDRVRIVGNTIGPDVRGEGVDLKEGTRDGSVSGNTFDGTGLTDNNYDDSWVDVKGNGYLIENNRGSHTINDGFQVHSVQDGWGCGTVFRANRSDLTGATGATRFAIDVTDYDAEDCPVTVASSNTVTGGAGLVNPGVPVS